MNILIVGGGFMGSALCELYATPQFNITLFEKNETHRNQLKKVLELQHVSFIESYEEAQNIQIVIEAVPENLQLKRKVMTELDEIFSPNIILCTNTSSYLISEIGENIIHKERLIGTHYFSPANITPLVEIVPTDYTSVEVIQTIVDCLHQINKKPIVLKREIEGFVANRLQSALAREAMSLVEKGVVTAKEVDEIAKWSIGIRLAMTGPIEQRDINGLDTHLALAQYVYPTLENTTTPLSILKEKVKKHKLGLKTAKGFYNWSNIDTTAYRKRKNQTLVEIINVLEEEGK